jgi:hypothetical protein
MVKNYHIQVNGKHGIQLARVCVHTSSFDQPLPFAKSIATRQLLLASSIVPDCIQSTAPYPATAPPVTS